MAIAKPLLSILIFSIVLYFLFGVYLFFIQKSMMYYPDNQDFHNCPGFKDYQKLEHKGTRFYLKQQSQKALVYYHGNAGSTCDRSFVKSFFETSDYTLIFVEYAGFSADRRKPSAKLILKDVENIHEYLDKNGFKNNLIYGQSIGSGAASYHAFLGNVDKLLLISPFSSMTDVAQSKYFIYPVSLLFTEKYDNLKWLNNYQGKIMIIHGDKDKIIPPKFSKKLFNKLSTQEKEYVLIPSYGHNDIWSSDIMTEKVMQFINGLEK